ncbi:hypothetical protein E1H18_4123 [Caulobacter sp. RHG1]|nr:hypothetical protein [Caulobacter sp. RHG1]
MATQSSGPWPPCPVKTNGAKISAIGSYRQSRSRAARASAPIFDRKLRRTWTNPPLLAPDRAFAIDADHLTRPSGYGAMAHRPFCGGTQSWTV